MSHHVSTLVKGSVESVLTCVSVLYGCDTSTPTTTTTGSSCRRLVFGSEDGEEHELVVSPITVPTDLLSTSSPFSSVVFISWTASRADPAPRLDALLAAVASTAPPTPTAAPTPAAASAPTPAPTPAAAAAAAAAAPTPVVPPPPIPPTTTTTTTNPLLTELRTVVWPVGGPARDLQLSQSVWHNQGFFFGPSSVPGCGFGFVQPANGPCGVLAATYAEMVRFVLTSDDVLPLLSDCVPDATPAAPTTDTGTDHSGGGGGGGGGAGAGAGSDPTPPPPPPPPPVVVSPANSLPPSDNPRVQAILHPSDALRNRALVVAMTTMLCRAAEGRPAGMPPSSWPSSCTPGPVTVVLPSSVDAVRAMRPSSPSRPPATKRADSTFSDGTLIDSLTIHSVGPKDVDALLTANLEAFTDGPGPLLLLYSLVLTRGLDRVRADWSDETSVASLIYENACTEQALMHLMLYGVARSNISPETWPGWEGRADIGFLTTEEAFTVAPALRDPNLPIWIVLAGGHYTTVFSNDLRLPTEPNLPPLDAAAEAAAAAFALPESSSGPRTPCKGGCRFYGNASQHGLCSKCFKESGLSRLPPTPIAMPGGAVTATTAGAIPTSTSFSETRTCLMYHFNGLHPLHANGAPTRLACVKVALYGKWDAADPRSPSAVDDAQQAINDSRQVVKVLERKAKPGGSSTDGPFLYHVVCKASGSMETAGGRPPPGIKWRCRDCHLSTPPNWYAINEPTASLCRNCGKDVTVGGFCHWLEEYEMPTGKLGEYNRAHAPPFAVMLRAKWPRADMDLQGRKPVALFG